MQIEGAWETGSIIDPETTLANLGHFILSLEVGDFYARRICVWVVLSDTGKESGFVGIFQCADRYRDLEANFPFVGFWSHWFFFLLSVFLSGFLAFVLTAKCGSAFFGRVALAIMEGAVLAEIVC
ncbi:hypothetical protein DY000_02033168 [Brassica cretica]|uniref:Uncharacterized protein n=1 Tax=Brassica cretica TaxID=69181 RepID=A0ABQ7DFZ0_BRACR|nr:hypothetical protein DY000_02033168 [Brassica cretica]